MIGTRIAHASPSDRCRTCTVRHLGFCSWFDRCQDHGRDIATRTHQSRFDQGATILDQGEPARRIGIILSGLVKIVLIDEEGEEHLIQLLHTGEMVGDPFASESACSWQAATDCELCWLAPGTLAAAVRDHPEAYGRQLEAAMRLVQEQRFAQIALRGRNALQRVAHWLFLQAPREATPAPVLLRIVLTRRDLASLLEMTVETLCRALHQLEERGAIRLAAPDLIDLRDRTLLKRLGRGHDERLQQSLLGEAWEWGARRVGAGSVAAPASHDQAPGAQTTVVRLPGRNDARRAS